MGWSVGHYKMSMFLKPPEHEEIQYVAVFFFLIVYFNFYAFCVWTALLGYCDRIHKLYS